VYPVPVLSLHEVTAAELGRAGAFWVLGEANAGAAALSAPPERPALNAGPAEAEPQPEARHAPNGNGHAVDAKATPVPSATGELVERVNALPSRKRPACMKALRAKFRFPDIAADRMSDALALVATYEESVSETVPTDSAASDPLAAPFD
jgi:hypothetical protein